MLVMLVSRAICFRWFNRKYCLINSLSMSFVHINSGIHDRTQLDLSKNCIEPILYSVKNYNSYVNVLNTVSSGCSYLMCCYRQCQPFFQAGACNWNKV